MDENFKTRKEILEDFDRTIGRLKEIWEHIDTPDEDIENAAQFYGKEVVDYIRHAHIELHLAIDYLEGAKRKFRVGMPKES